MYHHVWTLKQKLKEVTLKNCWLVRLFTYLHGTQFARGYLNHIQQPKSPTEHHTRFKSQPKIWVPKNVSSKLRRNYSNLGSGFVGISDTLGGRGGGRLGGGGGGGGLFFPLDGFTFGIFIVLPYEHGYFKLPHTWGTFSKNTWYFLSICRIDMIRSALESWYLQKNQNFFLKKFDLNHYVFPRYLRKSEAGKRSSTTVLPEKWDGPNWKWKNSIFGQIDETSM